MKKRNSVYCGLLLTALAAGCKQAADVAIPNTLTGRWRLLSVVCYCSPKPGLDEVLLLDAGQQFQVFRNGQLAAQGTYTLSRGPACGETTDRDQLSLAVAMPNTYAPSGAYTLQNGTLIIDQTNKCVSDGPIYTYERLPD